MTVAPVPWFFAPRELLPGSRFPPWGISQTSRQVNFAPLPIPQSYSTNIWYRALAFNCKYISHVYFCTMGCDLVRPAGVQSPDRSGLCGVRGVPERTRGRVGGIRKVDSPRKH